MIALPLVSSVIAPSAANAASVLTNLPLNSACTASSQCASGNCVNNSKCCSPSSTGTNAPASFFNFADGSPGSDCSTFSQSQQNAVCNSLFNAASCCNGTIIATSCFSFNPARFGCRCSPTPWGIVRKMMTGGVFIFKKNFPVAANQKIFIGLLPSKYRILCLSKKNK